MRVKLPCTNMMIKFQLVPESRDQAYSVQVHSKSRRHVRNNQGFRPPPALQLYWATSFEAATVGLCRPVLNRDTGVVQLTCTVYG